jgi:hypothetical protein
MGAGVSMGSLGEDGASRPPNWRDFLLGALTLIPGNADKKYATSLVNKSEFLAAAEVILDCCDRADFTNYLRGTFVTPRFGPSDLHKIILEIDPKIAITTNYDQIYDHYCNSGKADGGYNICRYYDPFAVDNLRSRIRLVIKAHGCVSDANKIVLSRSGYYMARRDYPGFYAILDAIFLTHTLLFVGCSLTDPDIQLVLENANIAVPSSHPHYALVEKMRHKSIKSAIKLTHNVDLIEYRKGKHQDATDAMGDLRDKVLARRAELRIS